eukprot:314447-Rhodomonas_salina.1
MWRRKAEEGGRRRVGAGGGGGGGGDREQDCLRALQCRGRWEEEGKEAAHLDAVAAPDSERLEDLAPWASRRGRSS